MLSFVSPIHVRVCTWAWNISFYASIKNFCIPQNIASSKSVYSFQIAPFWLIAKRFGKSSVKVRVKEFRYFTFNFYDIVSSEKELEQAFKLNGHPTWSWCDLSTRTCDLIPQNFFSWKVPKTQFNTNEPPTAGDLKGNNHRCYEKLKILNVFHREKSW